MSSGTHSLRTCTQVLEPLELTPETEAQWQQLAALAIEHNQVVVAERCYAAVGDFSKSRFLHKVRGSMPLRAHCLLLCTPAKHS